MKMRTGFIALNLIAFTLVSTAGCDRIAQWWTSKRTPDTSIHTARHAETGTTTATLAGDSLYQLDVTWQSHRGETVTLRQLRGTPVVLAMIYTSCEHVCPIIVEHFKRIADRLADSAGDVRFVLVSFDPARDTPEALKAYAKKKAIQQPNWHLLTGAPDNVRGLAALLGIRYRRLPDGTFSHSNTISVLDRHGRLVAQRKRLNEPLDELIAETQRLLQGDDG